MASKNLGGRPRELKDGKACTFTLDAATRRRIERVAKKMECSKSEAVRLLVAGSVKA